LNSKLTRRDAEFILVFYEFGFTKPELAREYGVHVDTIRNVLKGKSFQGRPLRSSRRKLTDDQARQVLAWAAEGVGEVRIQKRLRAQGTEIGRSTVRQVINGQSYQDVT